jgi:hypothetical protein
VYIFTKSLVDNLIENNPIITIEEQVQITQIIHTKQKNNIVQRLSEHTTGHYRKRIYQIKYISLQSDNTFKCRHPS